MKLPIRPATPCTPPPTDPLYKYDLPTQEAEPLKEAIRAVKSYWPEAFCEHVTDDEVFVYQNVEAKQKWNEPNRAKNLMVHLIVKPGLVSVILDEPDKTLVLPIHLYLNK